MFEPGMPLYLRLRIYRRRLQVAFLVAGGLFGLAAITIRTRTATSLPPRIGYFGPQVVDIELDELKEKVAEENTRAGGRPLPEALRAFDLEIELEHEAPDLAVERREGQENREIPPTPETREGPATEEATAAQDASVMPLTSRDLVILSFSKPPYPTDARLLGVEGVVTVTARIGIDGRVTDVRANPDHSLLASCVEAAIAATRKWRFAPLIRDGHPRVFSVEIPYRFKLGQVTID